eukprot:597215-Rhodomonas_salina.1
MACCWPQMNQPPPRKPKPKRKKQSVADLHNFNGFRVADSGAQAERILELLELDDKRAAERSHAPPPPSSPRRATLEEEAREEERAEEGGEEEDEDRADFRAAEE